MLDNHDATAGADILIDPKGDGMAADYLRAHYARHGSLENVSYFDCTETLPALSFFDIRDQLDAGIDRTTAVEDVVDHYIEILIGIMGRDRFEQAVRSPDIILVCYRGDVAWTYSDGKPLAIVPESLLYGVVEVKRGVNSSNLDGINSQLRRQQRYLDSTTEAAVPQILVGVQYFGGQVLEMVTDAVSDYVALIGDINGSGSARSMTEPASVGETGCVGRGCLEAVVSVLSTQDE
ncbi:hypothetical protein [Haloferax sp. Atlit-6N]|uniref:hypothetical protein n=1 Tax=Haloferax sp. Atlit-6N TaxID=2077205 RepID=UPI001F24A8DC|nr:hypothetical protein [Haloferax sp. Atlit-6N]